MAPKLTVVTPSYNQGRFIERTIRSVLEQGYPNLEFVIVDGGSTDETLDVIARFEDQLTWWISEPDEGQTDAINKGLERTDGEIVAYLNSDDYYRPGALKRVAEAFERTEKNWVVGAAADMLESDPPLDLGVWRPEPPPAGSRHRWLLAPWHVPQPSSFWRRDLFRRHGLLRTDMHFAFDAEFMVRLAMAGELPELLPDDVLAVRSEHPEQKSRQVRRFIPELRRIAELHRDELTPSERRRLDLLGPPTRARRVVSSAVLDPLKRRGGRALDRLPAGIRPPIRDRDRRPRLEGYLSRRD